MKIRTQSRITMLFFGVILAVMASSAIFTNRLVEKALQQTRTADDVAQGASELNYLANDYLIYREEQQVSRWQTRFAAFSAQTAALKTGNPEQNALVANIQNSQKRLKEVLNSVASVPGVPLPNKNSALDLAVFQVSWSRMAVQSQGLVSDASRLSQLLRSQADQWKQINLIVIWGLIGSFGVFFLVNYLLIQNRTLKSMRILQTGTAIIGSGNLNYTINERKEDEIGDLARAFNQMAANLKVVTASKADLEKEMAERRQAQEALKKAHDELEIRVRERTAELSKTIDLLQHEIVHRKGLEDSLRKSERQVRFFATQYLTAQEMERKRIAGELHDGIATSLAALKYKIEKTQMESRQGSTGSETWQEIVSAVQQTIVEVRRVMADLRPAILDDLGIIPALSWFFREFQKTYAQITMEIQIGLSDDQVPDSLRTHIFRITQEALNNIVKYSMATKVIYSLRKIEDGIELTIQENGHGFDLKNGPKGLGYNTMKERAELSGGIFAIRSGEGIGTTVLASWPTPNAG